MNLRDNLFTNEAGQPRLLLGVTITSNAPRLAELAGLVGFDLVWIEMEHGPAGFGEAESLCMAAESGGAVPILRVPDHHRRHVLRALEIGAHMVIVPMVNDAETAREIVRHGKYPPLGKRGFNTRSRGLGYGLEDLTAAFERANQRTHLIAQIETLEAVGNLEAICDVPGLSGIFIGPGDLSVSMGKTASFSDPELIRTVVECVRLARGKGKQCGIMAGPGLLYDAAKEAGCNFIFCGGDITDLSPSWRALLASLR